MDSLADVGQLACHIGCQGPVAQNLSGQCIVIGMRAARVPCSELTVEVQARREIPNTGLGSAVRGWEGVSARLRDDLPLRNAALMGGLHGDLFAWRSVCMAICLNGDTHAHSCRCMCACVYGYGCYIDAHCRLYFLTLTPVIP